MKKTAEEIAKAYKSPPIWYDVRGFFILKLSYQSGLIPLIRFFSNNMGSRHLEVAVGSGTLLKMIMVWRALRNKPAVEIIGVDYAESMLAGAIKNFAKNPRISFKLADVASMEFLNESFDTVNVANAIHCFPDVEAALKEMYRVLKRGGTLAGNVLLTPRCSGPFCKKIARAVNEWGKKKGILVTPYEAEDIIARLERTGFELMYQKIQGNCLNFIATKK